MSATCTCEHVPDTHTFHPSQITETSKTLAIRARIKIAMLPITYVVRHSWPCIGWAQLSVCVYEKTVMHAPTYDYTGEFIPGSIHTHQICMQMTRLLSICQGDSHPSPAALSIH